MKLKVISVSDHQVGPVSTTCPHCGNKGTFETIGKDLHVGGHFFCGQRVCPDPECRGHLFVVVKDRDLVFQHPPLRIAYNKQNIPVNIVKTFEEAVTCHSTGCFVAAAIMIRRTLEEICEERRATGKDLKDRIKSLKSKIVLPQELFEAMDELRILGNDAAHIEAKSYDQITKVEIDIAMEFTVELLKALYQYTSLLARMRGLKKTTP
ncbi:MAG: DUF4145 domain-containing protein [Desulfobacterales bacterium]|nr:DUF4145 domain-containing protein [Desulfobacterales bacterium]MBL7171322.1 DUF4145 domain-containing protein [Desulfobacteraceae bacterium]